MSKPRDGMKRRAVLRKDMNLLAAIQGSPIVSPRQDRDLRVKIVKEAQALLDFGEVIEVEVVQDEILIPGEETPSFRRTTTVTVGKDSLEGGGVWVSVDSLYSVKKETEDPKPRPHDKTEETPKYKVN
jgi:hypothetical protein